MHEYSRVELRGLLERCFGSVRMFFQWRAQDLFEMDLTAGPILRALVPVGIKDRLKRRRQLTYQSGLDFL